jgi:hypothetical protein
MHPIGGAFVFLSQVLLVAAQTNASSMDVGGSATVQIASSITGKIYRLEPQACVQIH